MTRNVRKFATQNGQWQSNVMTPQTIHGVLKPSDVLKVEQLSMPKGLAELRLQQSQRKQGSPAGRKL